jgi:hypothetical protein
LSVSWLLLVGIKVPHHGEFVDIDTVQVLCTWGRWQVTFDVGLPTSGSWGWRSSGCRQ